MAYINSKLANRFATNGGTSRTGISSRTAGAGEAFEVSQMVDNTDGFITLLSLSETI